MPKDLGTIHAVKYVRQIVTTCVRGVPIQKVYYMHVINDDTGEEISRDFAPVVRAGSKLDADLELKAAAVADVASGERLADEDAVKAEIAATPTEDVQP